LSRSFASNRGVKIKTSVLSLLFLFALVVAHGQKLKSPPPENFSGVYSFLHDGDVLQIDVEATSPDGAQTLSGYVSRFGDTPDDHDGQLTHYFTRGERRGDHVSFATKVVHGVWFEFDGTLSRGNAKSLREDGYFVLRGTLTRGTKSLDGKTSTTKSDVLLRMLPIPDEPVAKSN